MSRTVYMFLDESGNLDFSARGTKYFVLTSVGVRRPFPAVKAFDDYKYDCIEDGTDLEYFHCYNDRKVIRNAVFDLIASHLNGMRVDYLMVEKAEIAPEMQDNARFYPAILGHLLNLIVPIELEADAEEVIVITDTIPVNKKRRAVEKTVRTTLAGMLPPKVKYRILHHQSRSHYGLQVADYCCWAVFRKWERGDVAWYERIKPAVRNEFKMPASVSEALTPHGQFD